MSYLLPRPATPSFSVGVDERTVYIALAGRGVVAVDRPEKAKIATYLLPQRGFLAYLGGGQAIYGELHGADGNLLNNRHVNIRITAIDGKVTYDAATYPTDSRGLVIGPPVADGDMVHLYFPGDDAYASADTRYIR
jgi:hypothetical protein